MEDGSIDDWYRDEGGRESNSGTADAVASQEEAYDGEWSAKLTITAPPESGTRLFRWLEPRHNRDLYYEAWFFIPQEYRFTGAESTGRYLILFQFKSNSADRSRDDPIWFINVGTGRGGQLVPELVWWHRTLEGPHEAESGYREYRSDEVTLPVGRWFEIRARVRQSKDFDGIVQFWLDDEKIFDMQGVRTGFANCEFNDWCVDQSWAVNLYSDGLSPTPSALYVDAAQIRRVEE